MLSEWTKFPAHPIALRSCSSGKFQMDDFLEKQHWRNGPDGSKVRIIGSIAAGSIRARSGTNCNRLAKPFYSVQSIPSRSNGTAAANARTISTREIKSARGFRRGRTAFQNFRRNCRIISYGYRARWIRAPSYSVSVTVNEAGLDIA
jgi:hypothetical protein